MCRMYASLGPRGPPVEELLAFRGLCERGCGGPHDDGWGVVGYRAKDAPHILGKSTLPAAADKAYEAAASQAPAYGTVVAHLRKASVGAKVLDNTHPFTVGPWTFCHNGTIEGGYAERMAPHQHLNDSRALFARLHEHLRGDPLKAIRGAVGEVKERGFPYTSMTFLLTDGATLWAAREVREDHGYYELFWQRRGDRVVVCQERVFDGPWEEVPNGHVAVLTAKGADVRAL